MNVLDESPSPEACARTCAHGTVWTDEDDRNLREMWCSLNLSATQCAVRFGNRTRNAIIGRVLRLGLKHSGFVTPAVPKPKPLPRVLVRKAAPPPKPVFVEPEIVEPFEIPAGVTLMELNIGMCKWPLGDPRTESFRYCGEPHKGPGHAYCKHHHGIGYYKPAKAEKPTNPVYPRLQIGQFV